MFDVTSLGELLIDFAEQGSTPQGYPLMAANPGGAPANYLCALSSFGAKTRFIGKVGKDSMGDLLIRTLDERKVDTSALFSDPEVFTTLAFVTLDQSGDRAFSFARKPGADTCLSAQELPEDFEDTKIFHFGTISMSHEPARSATLEAVRRARAGGRLVSFDPNIRLSLWEDPEDVKTQMRTALPLADIVKISEEEVAFLLNCGPEEGARRLHEMGVGLAFITLGPDGCYFSRKDGTCGLVPGLKGLATIDTTGAGDIFGGSAAFGLLNHNCDIDSLTKEELTGIVQFACAAAGLSTTRRGGIPSVPTLEEATQLAQEYYNQ